MCEIIQTKVCSKCKVEKLLKEFHIDKRTKDGHIAKCRICNNSTKKLSGSKKRADEKYVDKNRESLYEKNKERYHEIKNDKMFQEKKKHYYQSKREYFLDYKKSWYQENKESLLEKNKKYREENKKSIIERARIYSRKKRQTDTRYKMIENIRTRVKANIRNKTMTVQSILACDWDTFRKHIENQFQSGMTWENNGRGEDKWHYDHHIPIASAKTDEELYQLNHYTNFKPLWEKENLRKSNKISEEWGNG